MNVQLGAMSGKSESDGSFSYVEDNYELGSDEEWADSDGSEGEKKKGSDDEDDADSDDYEEVEVEVEVCQDDFTLGSIKNPFAIEYDESSADVSQSKFR